MRDGGTRCRPSRPLWAIVLAGGEGTRLRHVTRALYAEPRPKQFCALLSDRSLLEEAVGRARLVVPAQRIVVSTTRRWMAETEDCLAREPRVRISEQPTNAGTTPGLLLALLEVFLRDPDAQVVVLPSDHYVSDDAAFMATALEATGPHAPPVVLLGAELDAPEDGLGWIERQPVSGCGPWAAITSFVEKPDAKRAAALHAEGALANTFTIVASVRALLELIARHAPLWWEAACAGLDDVTQIERAYRCLPSSDLSSEVLRPAANELAVVPLRGVVWSDVGTPERLAKVGSPWAVAQCSAADLTAPGGPAAERRRGSKPPGAGASRPPWSRAQAGRRR